MAGNKVQVVRLLKKRWKLMTMEKEQEVQERNHMRMNLELNHHHYDHEKYDQVQYDLEQKLYVYTILHIVHIRAGARCRKGRCCEDPDGFHVRWWTRTIRE